MVRLNNFPIVYWPSPKVASTSIKLSLYLLDHGREWQDGETGTVHDHYPAKEFESIAGNCFKFAIIRDPVERFISAYCNRVLDLGEVPENPSIRRLVHLLSDYRSNNEMVLHHTELQTYFIGNDAKYFDRIFYFNELSILPAEIEKLTGIKLILPHRQKRIAQAPERGLRRGEIKILRRFYKKDYELLEQLRN